MTAPGKLSAVSCTCFAVFKKKCRYSPHGQYGLDTTYRIIFSTMDHRRLCNTSAYRPNLGWPTAMVKEDHPVTTLIW